MPTYTIHTARAKLGKLVARALDGEDVVILARDASVRLVPVFTSVRTRVFGSLHGKVEVGPAFFDPLPPEESTAWMEG